MKKTKKQIEAAIPFGGFYNSILSSEIDQELEFICNPEDGYGDIPDEIEREIDWNKVYQNVAKLYVKAFEHWLNDDFNLSVELSFELMQSPKEYNFSTDRIFAKLSIDDAKAIYEIAKDLMPEMVKRKFTSRDGFISFYEGDFSEWPKDIEEWDHNEIGTLLDCLFEGEFEDATCQVLAYMQGNGEITEAIYAAASKKGVELMDSICAC